MGLYGINLIGVLVAGIVAMGFGFLWYTPSIFGRKWMRYVGISKRKAKEHKEKGMVLYALGGFISQIVMAFVLSIFLSYAGAGSIVAALIVAFLLWLGFIAMIQLGVVLWERKPWGLFWINSLQSLISLFIMAIILQLLA